MAKRGHSEEATLRVLQETESGETVVEVCRKHGISEQSFYRWKKNCAGLGLNEPRELRQLREENSKLKRLVADLSLDRHILQEIVAKELKGLAAAVNWPSGRNKRISEPAACAEADSSRMTLR